MEFFHAVNIDWMGKAKYFVALSLSLLIIGGISIAAHGGLRYGIDFNGGTLVYVRFAQTPPLDKIRSALGSEGLRDSTLQPISDISDPSSKNDVVIGLEQKGQGNEASGRRQGRRFSPHCTGIPHGRRRQGGFQRGDAFRAGGLPDAEGSFELGHFRRAALPAARGAAIRRARQGPQWRSFRFQSVEWRQRRG